MHGLVNFQFTPGNHKKHISQTEWVQNEFSYTVMQMVHRSLQSFTRLTTDVPLSFFRKLFFFRKRRISYRITSGTSNQKTIDTNVLSTTGQPKKIESFIVSFCVCNVILLRMSQFRGYNRWGSSVKLQTHMNQHHIIWTPETSNYIFFSHVCCNTSRLLRVLFYTTYTLSFFHTYNIYIFIAYATKGHGKSKSAYVFYHIWIRSSEMFPH
jgi:hypothetical protein